MANVSLQSIFSFALLFDFVTAGLDIRTVFLEKSDASSVISQRHRRANTGDEETTLPANLERECLEEVCDYEEAREVFQDNYRTDIFWSVYIDGDQCAVQPCKNGALCSDSVGGYDCICKSGFTGTYCETDQTVCPADDKTKGCDQFCKPGYQSYECLCARGWKLQEKEKCVPAVVFPCGKLIGGNHWASRLSTNILSEYKGLSCGPSECPWQAMLRHDSKGFCSGVILQDNMILTTAQCARTHPDFQVAVGKTMTSYEADEQVLGVKQVHVHPLYTDSGFQNDLAVVELKQKMVFKKNVVPACLPERDFADSVLMSEKYMGAVTGWKEDDGGAEFQGNLLLNHLSYEKLSTCSQRHSAQVTNKMSCSLPQANADCIFGSGSPVLTLYREVFFITALVSRPAGFNCANGHILQKVSRSLPWLNSFMSL